MRGAVAPRGLELELEHHLSGGVGTYALVGQCRAGDLASQLLQCLALVGAAAHGGVQAEPVVVGAQVLLEVRLPGHGVQQCQHLLSVHTWPELTAVTLDIYVCNLHADHSRQAEALMARLEVAFAAAQVERNRLVRGARPAR